MRKVRPVMWVLLRLHWLFALILLAVPAAAAGKVILMLETGGHMALIRSIAFTPDGSRLVSASDDKTIRVWDVETGRTVLTLRGEIEDGDPGKILTVAVSPDGRWLAAGGRTRTVGLTDHPIRLYDLESGRLVGLLEGHSDAVLSLAFSADGSLLASGGVDDTAILWDFPSRRILQKFEGHGGDVNAVRFTSDGARLITASDDRTAGLWDIRNGRRLAVMSGHEDLVLSLAVSPADGTIASGSFDKTIRLWNGETGEPVATLSGEMSNVMSLSYSPDGRYLLTGAGGSPFANQIWDVASRQVALTYRGHDNMVYAVAFSPDGKLAATAGGNVNEIQLWNPATGELVRRLTGVGRPVAAVGVAPDGQRIAWGHGGAASEPNTIAQLTHVLRLPEGERLTGEPRPIGDEAATFLRAQSRLGKIELSHRSAGQFGYYDTIDIVEAGKLLGSAHRDENDGYAHNAYVLTPDARALIAGGGVGYLSVYALEGHKLGEFLGHTGDVWAIAVSADGQRLVSGSDDQTLKYWNIETRELVLSVFHAANGEWVMWTPQGYFSASPDGDEYVGWQINQGPDKEARFVTAAQLKQHFYRPDIVRRALILGSARQAVAEAANTEFALDELLRRAPPEFSIVDPQNGSTVAAGEAEIGLALRSDSDIEAVEVTVNGRRVRAGVRPAAVAGQTHVLTVPLSSGENRLLIALVNPIGRTVRDLTLFSGAAGRLSARGKLFAVAIGVDEYPNLGNQNLDFAGADATALYRTLIERAGPLHTEVSGILLAKGGDREPTAANIRAALKLLGQAKPEDTIVLFLAGHGINDGADYLFLPGDAKRTGKGWVASSVVDWRLLQQVLEAAQGRRIMMVDTCHAGNAFNPRLVKDAEDASIAVFAATDAETLAQERPDLKHGVFTYSVLRGLAGAADSVADRKIQEDELSQYVVETVSSLTAGRQKPEVTLAKPANFVLSRY